MTSPQRPPAQPFFSFLHVSFPPAALIAFLVSLGAGYVLGVYSGRHSPVRLFVRNPFQTSSSPPPGQASDWDKALNLEGKAGLNRAIVEYGTLKEGLEKTKLLRTIASSGILIDRDATIAFIEHLKGTRAWTEAIRDASFALANEDPRYALQLVRELAGSRDFPEALLDVLTEGADTRPAWALVEAAKMPSGAAKAQAIAQIAQIYAERDFSSAKQAISQTEPGAAKNSLTVAVASVLGSIDPSAAAHQFLTNGSGLPDAVEREIAVRVMSEWIKTDPRACGDWVKKIENNSSRQRSYESYVDVLSRTDPNGAVAFVNEVIASGESNLNTVVAMAARGLAATSPQAAAEWLKNISWTPAVEQEFGYSIQKWARTDGEAAIKFLSTLSIPAQRDQAGAASALALVAEDADLSLKILQTVSDPQLRARTLNRIQQVRRSLEPATKK